MTDQFPGVTKMVLSLAAEAVLDAFNNRGSSSREWHDGKAASLKLAAALRAVADQVVPETNGMFISPVELQQEKTRDQLLAIANELEATT